MLAITGIISVYLTMVLVKEKMQASLFQVMPFVYSCLLLVLYGLSFINKLSSIDYMLLALLIVLIVIISVTKKWKEVAASIEDDLTNPRSLIWIISTAAGMYLLKDKAVYYWDDFVFWATNAKSIFFRDGLEPIIMSHSNGVRTYPPIPQLTEWIVLHLFGRFDSGFLYAGLFLSIQVYLAPLLDLISVEKKIVAIPSGVLFLIGFGAFSMNKMATLSPDFLVAVVFGGLLCIPFYKVSVNSKIAIAAVEMAIISIVKNVAFQWVGLVLLFYIFYYRKNILKLRAGISLICSSVPFITWCVYCVWDKINPANTVYKETGFLPAGQPMDGGPYRVDLFKSFIKAGISPMQDGGTLLIGANISWLVATVCLALLIAVYFYKYKRDEAIPMTIFLVFSVVAEWLTLLYFVEVLFLNEYEQYLDFRTTVLIYSRYGCPMVIGFLMLIGYLYSNKSIDIKLPDRKECKVKLASLYLLLCVVMCPWYLMYENFHDYVSDESMLEKSGGENYLSVIAEEQIVWMHDIIDDVANNNFAPEDELLVISPSQYCMMYVPYLMSPVKTTYVVGEFENNTTQDVINYVNNNGYNYFCYMDEGDNPLVLSDGNILEANTLYLKDGNDLKKVTD